MADRPRRFDHVPLKPGEQRCVDCGHPLKVPEGRTARCGDCTEYGPPRWNPTERDLRGKSDAHLALDELQRLLEERTRERDEWRRKFGRATHERNEAEERVRELKAALKTVRAECDLPEHVAEIIGDALREGSCAS
jgi:hypothetical protein